MRSDRATLDEETPQWVVEMEKLPLEQRMFPHLEGTGAVDFHRRPPTPAGAKLLMDVEYGEHGKLLYAYGRADGSERRPVVVLLHGGGWRFGTPFMCVRYAADLAALGYVTVCPQYRFSTDAIWPAQLEDARAAVAWVRANASRLGCDPERMVIGGQSAGGHIAMMLALTEPGSVRGVIDWYGPAALDDLAAAHPSFVAAVTLLLGSTDPDVIRQASPITYVSAAAPPFLVLAASADGGAQSLLAMHEALRSAGASSEFHVYEGVHVFDAIPAGWYWCFEHMTRFLERAIGRP